MIIKYLAKAACTQPLHIGGASGDKEEVLVHPVDDIPFIQAAGIAGVFRECYNGLYGEKQADALFGAKKTGSGENSAERGGKVCAADGALEDTGLNSLSLRGGKVRAADGALEDTGLNSLSLRGSKVCFTDGNFLQKPTLELRPRVRINPVDGTCDSGRKKGTDKETGHKFNMEYIGAGAEFTFCVYLYEDSEKEKIEKVFSVIHHGQVPFGGQKSNGCGHMKLTGLWKWSFDMKKLEDRKLWAKEDGLRFGEDGLLEVLEGKAKEKAEDILGGLEEAGSSSGTYDAYEIEVKGCTEGSMLVKSIAVTDYGEKSPDSMNIRNAQGDYIVPGSSLKGAVRNQMERIAAYLGREEIIQDTFGYAGSTGEDGKGKIGNISFYDTVVGEKIDNDMAKLSYRIHIDKFTGGVMNGGLFNEKNISGDLVFRISIKNKNHPDRTCGLLLMALRDMAIGVMGVGGGYNVGKGIIDVREIVVEDIKNGERAVLDFRGKGITEGKTIVSKCIRAVKAEGGTA